MIRKDIVAHTKLRYEFAVLFLKYMIAKMQDLNSLEKFDRFCFGT